MALANKSMKPIQAFKLVALSFSLGLASIATAGEIQTYTPEILETAKASGQTVVVDFYADWCSTCKAQGASLKALQSDPAFKDVTIVKANYDQEKALKKSLGVSKQSTLVVFRDGKEVARATGITDKAEITKLVQKGI